MQRLKTLLDTQEEQEILSDDDRAIIVENVETLASMDATVFASILSSTCDEKEISNLVKDISRLALISMLLDKASEGKLVVLDALDQCLTHQFGQHGPNSFKYMLLRNLCALEANPSHQVACATVDAYIQAVKDKKEEVAAARYAYAQGKFEALGVIQPTSLARVLRSLLEVKDVATESKYDGSSTSSAAQKFVVNIKNDQRRKQVETILTNLDAERLTVLEALHQCLTLSIGKKSENSFKYYVVSELFKLNNEDAKHASELVDCFVDIIKQQLDSIKSPLQVRVEKMLAAFYPPKSTLGILSYLADPDHYSDAIKSSGDESFFQSVSGFFQSKYKQVKEAARESLIAPIFNALKMLQITDMEALYQLLMLPVGQNGPHSFKYKLLAHLFGRKLESSSDLVCIEENDAESASKIIDCFVAVLSKQRLEQKTRETKPAVESKEVTEEYFEYLSDIDESSSEEKSFKH